MRKVVWLFSVLALAASSLFGQQQIVNFKNGLPANFAKQVNALGGRVLAQHSVLAVVDGLSAAAINKLAVAPGISSIQPDVTITLDDTLGAAKPGSAAMSLDPSAAYFYPYQWNMRAIKAPAAWNAGKLGSSTTTVAVIDTGIDYLYPDLLGRVDLSRSKSFAPTDDALVQQYFPTRDLITDINFHGTHVASTIVSNGYVVAGVTANITLIGVKVLATDLTTGRASGSLGMVLSGVLWAADQGADVANMSLGGGFAKYAAGPYVALINKTFQYAQNKGMLIVVAAGNSGMNMNQNGNLLITYCNQPHVVCVSATGPLTADSDAGPWYYIDAFAPYSNYGTSAVDVAAPGGNSGGYVWSDCSETTLIPALAVCQTGYYVVSAAGTSMAAPHVTGLAALLIDTVGKHQPALLKQRIRQSAEDLGQPGSDPFYGAGRINVQTALGIH